MSLYQKFFAVFILASFLFPVFNHGQKAEKEEQLKIPGEVAKIIKSNLAAHQERLDISLSYVHTLFKDKKLEPGEYVLGISVMDKIGKKEGMGKINFTTK